MVMDLYTSEAWVDTRHAGEWRPTPFDARHLDPLFNDEFDFDHRLAVHYGRPLDMPETLPPPFGQDRSAFDSTTAVNNMYRTVYAAIDVDTNAGGLGARMDLRIAFEAIDNARAYLDGLGASQSWQMLAEVPQANWHQRQAATTLFNGLRNLFGVRELDHTLRDDLTNEGDPSGTIVHLAQYQGEQFLLVELTRRDDFDVVQRGMWAVDLEALPDVLNGFSYREGERAELILRQSGALEREVADVMAAANRATTDMGGDIGLVRMLYAQRAERAAKPQHAEQEARGIGKLGRTARDLGRMAAGLFRSSKGGKHRQRNDQFVVTSDTVVESAVQLA